MAETTVIRPKTSGYVVNKPPAHARPVARNAPQAGSQATMGGALPVVQVKMTGQGPQVQNPHQAQPRPPRSTIGNQAAGGHPVVQVQMTGTGPQVQARSGAPDGAVGQQRIAQANANTRQSFVAAPPTFAPVPVTRAFVPEPVSAGPLSADQMLLCRHLLEAYLSGGQELSVENTQLAESAIVAIDAEMVAITEAEALAAMEPVQAMQPQMITPPPRQMIPPRTVIANQRSSQAHAAAAPRRVPRPAQAQPPAITGVTLSAPRPKAAPISSGQGVAAGIAPGSIIDVIPDAAPEGLANATAPHIDDE